MSTEPIDRADNAAPLGANPWSILSWIGRAIALTGLFLIYATFSGVVVAQVLPAGRVWLPESLLDPSVAGPWVAVALLYATAISYPIARSRWSGMRLVLVIFWVLFGIAGVLSLIEAAFFLPEVLSTGMLVSAAASQVLTFGLFAPTAAAVFGKWRRRDAAVSRRLDVSPGGWVWRLAVIAVAYVFLYLLFGALVAWRNPELRVYYRNLSLPPLGTILSLQVFRSLIWVAVALPVIKMMRGAWWETALALAVLFAVIMSAGLLLPSPALPEAVRMTHLVEVASSNFIFGWFVGWLLARRR